MAKIPFGFVKVFQFVYFLFENEKEVLLCLKKTKTKQQKKMKRLNLFVGKEILPFGGISFYIEAML